MDARPLTVALFLEAAGLSAAASGTRRQKPRCDPFVVVESVSSVFAPPHADVGGDEQEVGRTETVFNSSEPRWASPVRVAYRFADARQRLTFKVYDRCESDEGDVLLGHCECTVTQVMVAEDQRFVLGLSGARGGGRLVVRGEVVRADYGENVTLQIAGVGGLRKATKPYFELQREMKDGQMAVVKYSEVFSDYSSRSGAVNRFRPFTIPLAKLCNSDKERKLRLVFMNFDKRAVYHKCGSVDFTLAGLMRDFKDKEGTRSAPIYEVVKHRRNGSTVVAGQIAVTQLMVQSDITFLDYVQKGGVVINTVFAVDMSMTNGNPSDPGSIHFLNPRGPNEYEAAIRDVGNVLADLDSSKAFPSWGFGACLPPYLNAISHCFPLSDGPSAICGSVAGVKDAYREMLKHVRPHQPCKYGPVLRKVIDQARTEDERSNHSVYTVLVLFTDGDFVDYEDVTDLIVGASDLPLSIVIVGIGSAEKPKLQDLDGDYEHLQNSDGIRASRDIVQFVPFLKYRSNPAQLATAVLEEIPDQLVSFYRDLGIRPGENRTMVPGPEVPSFDVASTVAARNGSSSDLSREFAYGHLEVRSHSGNLSSSPGVGSSRSARSNSSLRRESSASSVGSGHASCSALSSKFDNVRISPQVTQPNYPPGTPGILTEALLSTSVPEGLAVQPSSMQASVEPSFMAGSSVPSGGGWIPRIPVGGDSLSGESHSFVSGGAGSVQNHYRGPTMQPPSNASPAHSFLGGQSSGATPLHHFGEPSSNWPPHISSPPSSSSPHTGALPVSPMLNNPFPGQTQPAAPQHGYLQQSYQSPPREQYSTGRGNVVYSPTPFFQNSTSSPPPVSSGVPHLYHQHPVHGPPGGIDQAAYGGQYGQTQPSLLVQHQLYGPLPGHQQSVQQNGWVHPSGQPQPVSHLQQSVERGQLNYAQGQMRQPHSHQHSQQQPHQTQSPYGAHQRY